MSHYTNPALCKSVNRLNLELLTFGKADVISGWNIKTMSPVFSRLYYITDGSFTIVDSSGNEQELESGNWYLFPAQYSCTFACRKFMEQFYFHIKLCDFDGADLLRNCKEPLCLTPEKPVDCAFLHKCLNSSDLTDGLALRQTVSEVLLSFMVKFGISIRANDYSPCIYKALVYIKQNLSMQLSIEEIADHVFISKSTLTKHFKKELSTSVNEYICNAIMAEAERLLLTSNLSIRELSQKYGYTDQLYFSKRFKEKFGISPREYRKNKVL